LAIKHDLETVVGKDFVTDDPLVLDRYARDGSLVQPRRASWVVYPQNTEEIQSIARYANELKLPLVPRSSKVSFYGAGIPEQGGIILDLSRMNRILEIDPPNKKVKVEAGATWAQVQAELVKHGLMVCQPLLPHQDKSVVTSAMQREPMLIPKSEYSETLLTAEIVLASGELLRTGTAVGKGMKGQCFPDALIPGTRLFLGAQGTLGIITWANLKAEYLPTRDKLFFMTFEHIKDVQEFVYRVQRRMLGSECFVLNDFNLAVILAESCPEEFEALRSKLPAWTVVLCLSGFHRLPEEKIAYEEEALMEIAGELGVQPCQSIEGVPEMNGTWLSMLRKPWQKEKYWKYRYRGGCHEVFFYDTLDKAWEYVNMIVKTSSRYGYATGDIGIYLQPVERARILFYQFAFYGDPENSREEEKVRQVFMKASERAMAMGALFATPYGPWADMVYRRATTYTQVLKVVKDAIDPNHIMNPGKLCF
jgi:FAD/FMN-containing dehydrogenase